MNIPGYTGNNRQVPRIHHSTWRCCPVLHPNKRNYDIPLVVVFGKAPKIRLYNKSRQSRSRKFNASILCIFHGPYLQNI